MKIDKEGKVPRKTGWGIHGQGQGVAAIRFEVRATVRAPRKVCHTPSRNDSVTISPVLWDSVVKSAWGIVAAVENN